MFEPPMRGTPFSSHLPLGVGLPTKNSSTHPLRGRDFPRWYCFSSATVLYSVFTHLFSFRIFLVMHGQDIFPALFLLYHLLHYVVYGQCSFPQLCGTSPVSWSTFSIKNNACSAVTSTPQKAHNGKLLVR